MEEDRRSGTAALTRKIEDIKRRMKYYIQRGINEYGPYTLAELQRYVAEGNIALTDLARSEAMTEWIPVSQIVGDIPVAPPPVPVAPAGDVMPATPSAGIVYSGAPAAAGAAPAMAVGGPVPPDLHWALVLLIGFFCGLFQYVWLFIEAAFVKKIKPDSNFLAFLITGLCLMFGSGVLFYAAFIVSLAANPNNPDPPYVALALFFISFPAGVVVYVIGIFKMRAAIQDYYNTVEPINLRLSGVMTFFFNILYFQYHFTRIANWKKTGYLVPQ
jgi:hypothetical protein